MKFTIEIKILDTTPNKCWDIVEVEQLKEASGRIVLRDVREVTNCSSPKDLAFFLGFLLSLAAESYTKIEQENANLLLDLLKSIKGKETEEFNLFSGASKLITNPIIKYLENASKPNLTSEERMNCLINDIANNLIVAESLIELYHLILKRFLYSVTEDPQWSADDFQSEVMVVTQVNSKEHIIHKYEPYSRHKERKMAIAIMEHNRRIHLMESPIREYSENESQPPTRYKKQNIRCVKKLLKFLANQGNNIPIHKIIIDPRKITKEVIKTECININAKMEEYVSMLSKDIEEKFIPVKLGDISLNLVLSLIRSNDMMNLLNKHENIITDLCKNIKNNAVEKIKLSCEDEVSKTEMMKSLFYAVESDIDNPMFVQCVSCRSYLSDKDLLSIAKEEAKKEYIENQMEDKIKFMLAKVFQRKRILMGKLYSKKSQDKKEIPEKLKKMKNEVTEDICLICKERKSKYMIDSRHKFCKKHFIEALSNSLRIPDLSIDYAAWPIKCPLPNWPFKRLISNEEICH